MERSNVTLQPYPTPEEIYKDMIQLYLDNRGFGDIHDAYRVLLKVDAKDIGIQLFSVLEDVNEEEMLKQGMCPECGSHLTYRPNLEMFYCTNNACGLGYNKPTREVPLSGRMLAEYGEVEAV